MDRISGAVRWFLCAAAILHVRAQTAVPESPPVIRAETRVVQVEVIATDSHGKPISGLTKGDFSIRDNGKPRAIDIFSVDSGADSVSASPRPKLSDGVFTNRGQAPPQDPRAPTVILLDASKGANLPFQWARQAVMGVLNKLPSDESVAVYVVADKQGLVLLQDYTTDHAMILRRMKGYSAPPPPPQPARNTRPLTPEEVRYIALSDSENTFVCRCRGWPII